LICGITIEDCPRGSFTEQKDVRIWTGEPNTKGIEKEQENGICDVMNAEFTKKLDANDEKDIDGKIVKRNFCTRNRKK